MKKIKLSDDFKFGLRQGFLLMGLIANAALMGAFVAIQLNPTVPASYVFSIVFLRVAWYLPLSFLFGFLFLRK